MAWDEKNRDEWAKQFLEPLGLEGQQRGKCLVYGQPRKTFKEAQIPLEGTEGATMRPLAAAVVSPKSWVWIDSCAQRERERESCGSHFGSSRYHIKPLECTPRPQSSFLPS